MSEPTSKIKVIKASTTLQDRNRPEYRKLRVAAYCRVSTLSDEQKDSFKSQVTYYTDYIKRNPEWDNAGIYADEGITGTSDEKRPQFLKMIQDAMDGKIDIILVKSLSRFSRNTVDTLNYVRTLKNKNVAVRFEEEHIDTLTQDGELMLTILGSVAQQEVQNTSEHVKRGLKMKMVRGELIGFQGCLGYDYDPVTKAIFVNKKEAEIVQYIFKRYLEGAGTTVIARELQEKKVKTKYGEGRWFDSTILGVIKNEKYKGDLMMGKTFTVDPISKRRLVNQGESDRIYINDHHEAITSIEDWNKANEILKERSFSRKFDADGSRSRYSRKYPFSSIMECGFCHNTLGRKHWKSGANYDVTIWQCLGFCKHGKSVCADSKGLPEETIEGAFVDAYNKIVGDKSDLITDFITISENALSKSNVSSRVKANEKFLVENKKQQDRLAGLYVKGSIKEQAYQKQFSDLVFQEDKLKKENTELGYQSGSETTTIESLQRFKEAVELSGKKPIAEFSEPIFDTCIQKVIAGGYDDANKPDPYKLTFIFKSGFKSIIEQDKTYKD
jgi:DNA invertase Pin-like site-specific DNA recombinase